MHFMLVPSVIMLLAWRVGAWDRYWLLRTYLISSFVPVYLRALEYHNRFAPPIAFLWATWLTPLAILLGFAIACGRLRVSGRCAVDVGHADQELDWSMWGGVLAVLPTFVAVVYLVDVGTGRVALFEAIRSPGEALGVTMLRTEWADSRFGPIVSATYGYFRALVLPLIAAITGVLAGRGRMRLVTVLAVLVPSVFFAGLSAAKAPIAILLASFAVGYAFANGRPARADAVRAFGVASIGLAGSAALYPLLLNARGDFVAILRLTGDLLWRRLSFVPVFGNALHFVAFPASLSHPGVCGNRVLSNVFGSEGCFRDIPSEMFSYFASSPFLNGRFNASASAAFYAEWGFLGMLVGLLLVGAVLAVVTALLDSVNEPILRAAAASVAAIAAVQLNFNSAPSVFLGRGLVSAPLLSLGLLLLARSTPVRSLGSHIRGFVGQ